MGVYKRGNIWYIDYYFNGKRKREPVGPSKKLADTVLNKRKTQIAEGKFLDIKKIKRIQLEPFVYQFIETYSKPNKVSWADDLLRLKGALEFFGSNKYLHEIGNYEIEQFKKHRLSLGNSPATVNKYLKILKTMYYKAVEWNKAETNPFTKTKFLREVPYSWRFLEKEEITRLLEASSGYLKPIIIIALNTGMRRGEIFNLKWSDVDLKNKLLYVNRAKNNERRVIPINGLLRKTLLNLREHSETENVVVKKKIQKPFAKALKCAKIPHCRFHDLRHTFASHLVMSGVDLMTVKELLGHKSIEMTMRYAHLSQHHKSNAIEKMGSMIDTIWPQKAAFESIEKELSFITADS